jgi:hypothetical protein
MRPLLTPVDWVGVAALIADAIADLVPIEHRPTAAEVDTIVGRAAEKLRQLMLTRSVPQPIIETTLDAMIQAFGTRLRVTSGSPVQKPGRIRCN